MARGVPTRRTPIDSMRICCACAESAFDCDSRRAHHFAALRHSSSRTREPRPTSAALCPIRKSASTWAGGTGMRGHSTTWCSAGVHARAEEGTALLIVLLAMTLLMALGGGLLMVVATEVRIAAHYRDGLEAFHAADALVERIRSELRQASDVGAVLTGDFTSTLVDGLPGGERRIPDGTINLTDITNIERCNRIAACGESALDAATAERPWGVNNPRWRLYSYGWIS